MTKKEAVANHRKMWNWIANETLKRSRCVHKEEYFCFSDYRGVIPSSNCFCCQYNKEHRKSGTVPCIECPIVFNPLSKTPINCVSSKSPFKLWSDVLRDSNWNLAENLEKAAKYAREIAELPEREDDAG